MFTFSVSTGLRDFLFCLPNSFLTRKSFNSYLTRLPRAVPQSMSCIDLFEDLLGKWKFAYNYGLMAVLLMYLSIMTSIWNDNLIFWMAWWGKLDNLKERKDDSVFPSNPGDQTCLNRNTCRICIITLMPLWFNSDILVWWWLVVFRSVKHSILHF